MSLFVTLTPAENAAGQIKRIVAQQFINLAQAGHQGFNTLWNNKQATPQEICAALGTDAAAIFALSGLNATTLAQAASLGGTATPSLPAIPAGFTVTSNSDGSVTITKNN